LIVRIWHGRTRPEDAEAYLAFLRERAIPDYQGTPGNRGVFLLRRVESKDAHFLTRFPHIGEHINYELTWCG
jgi:hypothetical protein